MLANGFADAGRDKEGIGNIVYRGYETYEARHELARAATRNVAFVS
jgi:hypothetical protein